MAADPNPHSKFPYPRRPWFELGLGIRWEVLVGGGCVGCAKGTYNEKNCRLGDVDKEVVL
jgi:hypothetical protein